ncbi:metal-dependent transcriptional regulator [Promethearchaeum syntrophicum]|uniref:Metal-dependent transcriptional regulator n=1 Tax=Promethearchaeum syntrophicum TaxID=2594042 RepID=A0A5B9DCC5_9ARCH|nr:metal-dependent transcriptional regulator [Candidatus Prometheoarchaeum syntrophicum]
MEKKMDSDLKKTSSDPSIYKSVTNRDKIYSESYDEYVEAIYRLSLKNPMGWVKNKEISERLKVKAPSVSNMLEKLASAKLIEWKPRSGIRLSKKGKDRGKELIMNHVVMELFFERILNMTDPDQIDKLACEFEHHITPDIKIRLMNLLGIDENLSNVDNFIVDDKLPKHIITRSIYPENHIMALLGSIENDLKKKISSDSNNEKIVEEVFKTYKKKYQN